MKTNKLVFLATLLLTEIGFANPCVVRIDKKPEVIGEKVLRTEDLQVDFKSTLMSSRLEIEIKQGHAHLITFSNQPDTASKVPSYYYRNSNFTDKQAFQFAAASLQQKILSLKSANLSARFKISNLPTQVNSSGLCFVEISQLSAVIEAVQNPSSQSSNSRVAPDKSSLSDRGPEPKNFREKGQTR